MGNMAELMEFQILVTQRIKKNFKQVFKLGLENLNNKKVIPYSSFKILNRKKVTLSKIIKF